MRKSSSFQENYFGRGAELYARYRPSYPDALFESLVGLAERHALAWDCATGSGQAASGLAPHFERVIATDASAEQIRAATGPSNVEFNVASAEDSQIESASVDLVTVATALHWFDCEAFFAEVDRVLRPGGVLAFWCYEQAAPADPAVAEIFSQFASETLGPYWDERVEIIKDAYAVVEPPFDELPIESVGVGGRWHRVEDVLGYTGTWSAVERYRRAQGVDPRFEAFSSEVDSVWPKEGCDVVWKIQPRAFRKESV